jgi:hypothetical protein
VLLGGTAGSSATVACSEQVHCMNAICHEILHICCVSSWDNLFIGGQHSALFAHGFQKIGMPQ